jgi:hypothetical protein
LWVKIEKQDRQEIDVKNRINEGRAITAMLNGVLWNRQMTRKDKLQIYSSIVKNIIFYGVETWKFNSNLETKLMSMEVDFLGRSTRCSRL